MIANLIFTEQDWPQLTAMESSKFVDYKEIKSSLKAPHSLLIKTLDPIQLIKVLAGELHGLILNTKV